jgi:hypothetical protein
MARAKKPVETVELFRAALSAVRGRTAKSPLYRWLRANHDEFLVDWSEGADWPAFVQGFTALGLTDRTGKAPVPETARKTWLQVRRDVAKAKAKAGKQAKGMPVLASNEIAPGVRAVQPLTDFSKGASRTPITLDIRPARPRLGAPPAEPAPSSSQPLPLMPETQSHQSANPSSSGLLTEAELEADLRRLREQMNARTVPIPKPV